MNRIEFIEKLRQALAGELLYHIVDENVAYYEDYIDMELRKGRTETEILQQLGDPRLIAKTIIATNKAETNVERETEYDPQGNREENPKKMKRVQLPGWLLILIVIVVGFIILGLVTTLFAAAFPYIIIIMLISTVVRYVHKRF